MTSLQRSAESVQAGVTSPATIGMFRASGASVRYSALEMLRYKVASPRAGAAMRTFPRRQSKSARSMNYQASSDTSPSRIGVGNA